MKVKTNFRRNFLKKLGYFQNLVYMIRPNNVFLRVFIDI
jgi:hypothetical protein